MIYGKGKLDLGWYMKENPWISSSSAIILIMTFKTLFNLTMKARYLFIVFGLITESMWETWRTGLCANFMKWQCEPFFVAAVHDWAYRVVWISFVMNISWTSVSVNFIVFHGSFGQKSELAHNLTTIQHCLRTCIVLIIIFETTTS